MKRLKTAAGDAASTQTAILDAVESIMRDEGYAAVSSRRIAERAGLKSRLAHYHFGSMDEVFLSVLRRIEDRLFLSYTMVMQSENQFSALWKSIMDNTDAVLMLEFTALANHRKSIRNEIARCIERARGFEVAVLARALKDLKINEDALPPIVGGVLLAGVARVLTTEKVLGLSKGHAETWQFIDNYLRKTRQGELEN